MTGDSHGVRRLAKEMILTAWRDAHGGYLSPNENARRQAKAGARFWIESGDTGGLTFDECAEVLGIDPGAVRARMMANPPKADIDDDRGDLVDAR